MIFHLSVRIFKTKKVWDQNEGVLKKNVKIGELTFSAEKLINMENETWIAFPEEGGSLKISWTIDGEEKIKKRGSIFGGNKKIDLKEIKEHDQNESLMEEINEKKRILEEEIEKLKDSNLEININYEELQKEKEEIEKKLTETKSLVKIETEKNQQLEILIEEKEKLINIEGEKYKNLETDFEKKEKESTEKLKLLENEKEEKIKNLETKLNENINETELKLKSNIEIIENLKLENDNLLKKIEGKKK
jgi:DNA repair exonuclease SbcCD ATPase subunit